MGKDSFSDNASRGESQNNDFPSFDVSWEDQTPSRSWQIIPPIVTNGRLPVIPSGTKRINGRTPETRSQGENNVPYFSPSDNPSYTNPHIMTPGITWNQVEVNQTGHMPPLPSPMEWREYPSAQQLETPPVKRPGASPYFEQSGGLPAFFGDSAPYPTARDTSLLPPARQSSSASLPEIQLVRRASNILSEQTGKRSSLLSDSSYHRAQESRSPQYSEQSGELFALARRPAWQRENTTGWQRGVRPGLPPNDYISRSELPHSYPGLVSTWIARKSMAEKSFVPPFLQPGLAGLADGSILTLAPIFSAALISQRSLVAFAVGLATALCISISIAISGLLTPINSDTQQKDQMPHSLVTGLQVFLGGLIETLPFLIPTLPIAIALALFVATAELIAISIILARFFATSLWFSLLQIVGGGLLVLLIAMLIGKAL